MNQTDPYNQTKIWVKQFQNKFSAPLIDWIVTVPTDHLKPINTSNRWFIFELPG